MVGKTSSLPAKTNGNIGGSSSRALSARAKARESLRAEIANGMVSPMSSPSKNGDAGPGTFLS